MCESMYRRHQADELRRVRAVVVHNDLVESSSVENPILGSVQDAATLFGIEHQAICANTLSE